MITLYRVEECKACDEVQATLRDLVVAHQVVDIQKSSTSANGDLPTAEAVPLIVDGNARISGQPALQEYLADLTKEMEQWRKFQVDACYIDDNGQTC